MQTTNLEACERFPEPIGNPSPETTGTQPMKVSRCEPMHPALIVATAVLLVAVIVAPVGVAVILIGNPEPRPSSLQDAGTGYLVCAEFEGVKP